MKKNEIDVPSNLIWEVWKIELLRELGGMCVLS